jgi:PAS domain S-box-containing protein
LTSSGAPTSWLQLPTLGDEHREEKRIAVLVLGAALLVAGAYSVLTPPPDPWYRQLALLGVAFAVWRARRGEFGWAALILPLATGSVVLDTILRGFGLHDVTILGLPLVMTVAGVLVGGRGALAFGALAMGAAALAYHAEASGWLVTPWSAQLEADALAVALLLLAVNAVALAVLIGRLHRSLERSRAQAVALRASEARWRSLILDAPLTLIGIDEQTRITFTNLAAGPSLSLLGRDVHELFEGEHLLAARDAIARCVGDGAATAFEAEMGTGPGDRWWYSVHAGPVHVDGRIAGATLVCIDVMERHRARQEREALIRALAERNAELQTFTYTVSHDLRSPLVTITGFLEPIVAAARSGRLDQVETDVARVRRAADRMAQLLSDLLELSRVGRVDAEPQRFLFAEAVAEAAEQVAGQISARGAELVIAPDLPEVVAPRRRVVQLVQNLLENAVKFAGDAAVPRIEVGAWAGEEGPVLFVRDNGIGIAAEDQERAFGLFERLDPQVAGTGFGLSLARRIVESVGGRIWVESEGRGHGATFCFTLPTAGPDGDR